VSENVVGFDPEEEEEKEETEEEEEGDAA